MKHLTGSSALFAVLLLFLTGCGYHVGRMGHPQIHSIGIEPVVNDTSFYNASAMLRMALSEQFMVDGTYKVVARSKADSLVCARIVSVTQSAISESSYNNDGDIFTPDEWQLTVTAEFTVIVPGNREPLIRPRTVSGTSQFQSSGGMSSSRHRGLQMACRDLAEKIVEFTAEGF